MNNQSSSNLYKKIGIRFFYSLLVFFMALSLFILALPTVASTQWGLSFITQILNSQYPGQATIQKANFSWFGGQTIEGFNLKDKEKGLSLNFQKFTTDATLLNLWQYGIKAGESRLFSLNATLKPLQEGPSIILEDVDARIEASSASNPLILNLTGCTRQDQLIGTFDLTASLSQITPEELLKYTQDTDAFLKDEQQGRIELRFKANNLPADLLDRFLVAVNPRLGGLLRNALGEKIDFSIEQTLANNGLVFLFKAFTPTFTAELEGSLSPHKFTLNKPAHISFNILPELTEWLVNLDTIPKDLNLGKTIHTQWDLKQLDFDLNLKTLHSPIIQLILADLKGHLDLPPDFIMQGISPSFDFTIQADSQQGNMELLMPVNLLASIINRPELTTLLGNDLNVKLLANLKPQEHPLGHLNVQLTGEGIEANASFIANDVITLNNSQKPATLKLNLTPERFKVLHSWLLKFDSISDNDLSLIENAEILMELTSLNYPWKDKSLSQIGMNAGFTVDKLKISSQIGEELILKNINARIETPSLAKVVNFNVHANQALSDLTFAGSLENAFKENGDLNKSHLSLKLDTKLTQFPASLVANLIDPNSQISEKLDAMFGKTLDVDLKVQLNQMEGPLKAEIKGKNGHMTLDAQIANNILTLNHDFKAEFAITPELGKNVLQKILPLLSGITGAQNPLKIWLSKEGFHVPVNNFSLDKVLIGQAILDLGKVEFSKTGELASVLQVLNIGRKDNIPVWFTPLYLNMSEGILKVNRLDMLISDRFPIATWGKVDFPNDKVKLIIGLTGKALTQAFNIQGLDSDYILQLPLTGAIGKATLDTTTAAAKVGALIAQAQGPHGVLIGTIIHIAAGGLGEEKAPRPTTDPLPWKNQMADSEMQKENSKENTLNDSLPNEKPAKSSKKKDRQSLLEKEANSILESLFG